MKIAIVSDTHSNLANIKKILDYLSREKIKVLFHCGDIAGPMALSEGFKDFSGKIFLALGNADFGEEEDYKSLSNVEVYKKYGDTIIDGKRIAFTHYSDSARELVESGKYDLIFYGHTHKPWEEKVGDCRVINPGEAAGQYQKATFAIYDTENDKLELKILEKLV
jgi:putative phosphoesterase